MLITIAIFGALATATAAFFKNRNPIGWSIVGALMPLIGLILVLVLPTIPPESYSENRSKPS